MSEINKIIGGRRNIRYKRGDDLLPITIILKLNGTAIDLTGSTFSMNVIAKDDPAKTAILSFTHGSGITLTASLGKIVLSKTAAQMTIAAGDYLYDLQEINSLSIKKTWLSGFFIVEDDRTT